MFQTPKINTFVQAKFLLHKKSKKNTPYDVLDMKALVFNCWTNTFVLRALLCYIGDDVVAVCIAFHITLVVYSMCPVLHAQWCDWWGNNALTS